MERFINDGGPGYFNDRMKEIDKPKEEGHEAYPGMKADAANRQNIGYETPESKQAALPNSLKKERTEARMRSLEEQVEAAVKLLTDSTPAQQAATRLALESLSAEERTSIAEAPGGAASKELISNLSAELARRGFEKQSEASEAISNLFKKRGEDASDQQPIAAK